MRKISTLIAITFVVAIGALLNSVNAETVDAKKILVVYYSHSGNTKQVANKIHKKAGGDIFEIKTSHKYTSAYKEHTEQAKKEIAEGFKPELTTKVDNIKKYDVIFIGTPIWWGTMAPPVLTFLSEYDLSGKTVVPFCTHGGGGQARTFADIAKLAPKSKILKGGEFYGNTSTQGEIDKWLNEIGLIK